MTVFECFDDLSVSLARRKVIESVQVLTGIINGNEDFSSCFSSVQPIYMAFRISIMNPMPVEDGETYITRASMSGGKIRYSRLDLSEGAQPSKIIYQETYEEALAIVQDNQASPRKL